MPASSPFLTPAPISAQHAAAASDLGRRWEADRTAFGNITIREEECGGGGGVRGDQPVLLEPAVVGFYLPQTMSPPDVYRRRFLGYPTEFRLLRSQEGPGWSAKRSTWSSRAVVVVAPTQ